MGRNEYKEEGGKKEKMEEEGKRERKVKKSSPLFPKEGGEFRR